MSRDTDYTTICTLVLLILLATVSGCDLFDSQAKGGDSASIALDLRSASTASYTDGACRSVASKVVLEYQGQTQHVYADVLNEVVAFSPVVVETGSVDFDVGVFSNSPDSVLLFRQRVSTNVSRPAFPLVEVELEHVDGAAAMNLCIPDLGHSFDLFNHGGGTLRWRVEIDSTNMQTCKDTGNQDVPCLEFNPSAGEINAGDSFSVDVYVLAPPVIRTDTVTVHSNEGDVRFVISPTPESTAKTRLRVILGTG